jgi:hypothetical protein
MFAAGILNAFSERASDGLVPEFAGNVRQALSGRIGLPRNGPIKKIGTPVGYPSPHSSCELK